MIDIDRAVIALTTIVSPGSPLPTTLVGRLSDTLVPLGLHRELRGLRATMQFGLPPAIQAGNALGELEQRQWVHRLHNDGLLDAAAAAALVAIWQRALGTGQKTSVPRPITTTLRSNPPQPDLRIRPVWATKTGTDTFGFWASFAAGNQVQIMRFIPAGIFQMGSENGGDERPVHQVAITQPFWLGDCVVTQGLWEAMMGSIPSCFTGNRNRPVEMVSWDDCQWFFRKLNGEVLGLNARFPTEAQWEYACRAGTTGDYAGDPNEMAWHVDNAGGQTHPVKTKRANAWGLHDMHGNVWEWCNDWFGDYSIRDITDPTGPPSGSERVRRGGSWHSIAKHCRSAIRWGCKPGHRSSSLSFRLCAPA
jgi:formylglycine-generating enzyme required for sulfatase activity